MKNFPDSYNHDRRRAVIAAVTRPLCIALALLLIITPVLPAQQPDLDAAPVPPQIALAQSIFVSNGGASNYFEGFTGGADRAYNSFYTALEQSSKYQLVSTPTEADLIFEIRAIAPSTYIGDGVSTYNPQLILSILDPQTRTVLWTTSANVRALRKQKQSDRGFDQSMAVLVYKLAQVTGQPLTAQQQKAVKDNSSYSFPTAAKVFLVVSGALLAGLTVYGIHRATHPPTLPMPTLPKLPPGFGPF